MFYKKAVLKNFEVSQKHTCVGVFFLFKILFEIYNFLEKIIQHRRFPVNFAKFLKIPFHRTISDTASERTLNTPLSCSEKWYQNLQETLLLMSCYFQAKI